MKTLSRGKTGLKRGRKRAHEMAVRTTVSMPPLVFDWGNEGMRERGSSSFSDFVADLIRQDKKNRQAVQLSLWSPRGSDDGISR
jgi:hypothetical protein